MAKTVLGKGLGELMNGGKPAGQTPARPLAEPTEGELFGGRGVQTLLTSSKERPSGGGFPAPEPAHEEPFSIPAWFFFGADLLLLALALVLVIGPKPLPTWNVGLALAATVLGCCSAIVGVYSSRK